MVLMRNIYERIKNICVRMDNLFFYVIIIVLYYNIWEFYVL